MAFDPRVRRFMRAAKQRYTAATLLLHEGLNLEGMYLAGYVVECAIKAMILAWTVENKRNATIAEAFRGRRRHDYGERKALLPNRKCVIPSAHSGLFREISSWSTDLRYHVGYVESEDAKRFVGAAKTILDGALRSI